ncbi:Malate dehydrogenase, cytoplasmic [Golovinomyces cichoracearum]|uniref:Malate dehydrogenase n=1 Tax=Golovinomyces cichoracearum TaxID=62708 RepID=A0A420HG88_9PEZI|nr:Malate dehydrogenase, cytoplasmic [Golovinomyces cichoracearum]
MGFKAVVAGASGGIGQPLSLLLKTCPLITELALYDVVNTPGVAKDLSHISSPAKVTGHLPQDDGAIAAFQNADIVVIPAGVPRKPGMSRDDLFTINAGIVKGLIEIIADVAPKAFILIISNPVNSTVPIAAEVLKSKKIFNAKRLFGVTTLDVVRAQTFLNEIVGGTNPQDLKIPVVGGHSGATILPLFSQAKPSCSIPSKDLESLVHRVQYGGDEVVAAKQGAGSATLSMAYAGYRFTEAVLKALSGEKGIVEPSYVYLSDISGGDAVAKKVGVNFFSVPVELGTEGIEKIHDPLNNLTEYEQTLLKSAASELAININKGIDFVQDPHQK